MDIYFKSAIIMVGGVVFAGLVMMYSTTVSLAELVFYSFYKEPISNTLDVTLSDNVFIVDKKSFVQFAIGNQDKFNLYLASNSDFEVEEMDINKIRIMYDLDMIEVIGMDYTGSSGWTPSNMEAISKVIRIELVTEEFIASLGEEPDMMLVLDISGVSGSNIESILEFEQSIVARGFVIVIRTLNDDGTINLICVANNEGGRS